ncbi:aquaporin Z [Trinickia acidisoli]|uniref:aquaporin Z n=1 Tax=Trinickia acidisoli TaxID=2767482 RepID=UPI001A8CD7FB|nr:aquaporin Z [Trinickia acidisoli]
MKISIRSYGAEFVGTFWLVFGGCGSALVAANFHAPDGSSLGIGLLGVALAFGLTVLTMIYAIGPISGGHMNPAVTIGLTVAGRFPARHIAPYVVAQVIGAIAAVFILSLILAGKAGFDPATSRFAANGFGPFSPGGYSAQAAFICEAVMTAFFVFVILGATDKRAPAGFAPIAIGLCLTLIHLVSIPVTNTSVNPARSTGPALFAGQTAIDQLWLFWAAPIVGAVLAGVIYPLIAGRDDATQREREVILESEKLAARGD